MAIHRLIEPYSIDKHVFLHTNGGQVYRKGWEWTHCIYGLDVLGVLHSPGTALGVGAGREALIFFLADQGHHVTALDLYGNEEWSGSIGKEATSDIVRHPQRWCPKQMDMSRIRFVNGSGTDLHFPDGTFDLSWSLSSIEHFGGHEAASRAVSEMARVTKDGGIVVIATEYLLLEEYRHFEFFTRRDLQRYVIEASPHLELVSDVNWQTLPYEYLVDSITFPAGVDRRRRHVVLNNGEVQWTSILLFFRKH